MQFDLTKLGPTERYKLLTSVIVPRPIALVVTRNKSGHVNAAPFSYFNFMAFDPPTVVFGISFLEPGNAKDTGNNIRANGEFVVNLVSREMAAQTNIAAIEFGPEVSEIDEAQFETTPSIVVAPPRIKASPVSLECTRYTALTIGDNAEIVVGRVLMMHIRDDAMLDVDRYYVDTPKLDLIGRMHGRGWYTTTRDQFEVPRISVSEWKSLKGPATKSQT